MDERVKRVAHEIAGLTASATNVFTEVLSGYDHLSEGEKLGLWAEIFMVAAFAAYTVPESYYPKEGYDLGEDILQAVLEEYLKRVPRGTHQDNKAMVKDLAKTRFSMYRQLWDFADLEELERALKNNMKGIASHYSGLNPEEFTSGLYVLWGVNRAVTRQLWYREGRNFKDLKEQTRYAPENLTNTDRLGLGLNQEIIKLVDRFLEQRFPKSFRRNRLELEELLVPFIQYFTGLILEEKMPRSAAKVKRIMKETFLLGFHLAGREGEDYIRTRVQNSHKWVLFDIEYRERGETGAKGYLRDETLVQMKEFVGTAVGGDFLEELWRFFNVAREHTRNLLTNVPETEPIESPLEDEEVRVMFLPTRNWKKNHLVTEKPLGRD